MNRRIIIILIFILCFSTNICFAQQRYDSPEEVNPPIPNRPDVKEEADNKCEEAHALTLEGAVERATKLCASLAKSCSTFDWGELGGDIANECSLTQNECILKRGQAYFDMCNMITEEVADSVCNDPSNFNGPPPQLAGTCPCPGGIDVKQDGCQITFTCRIGGDSDASVTVKTPCPTIRGTDPKYPLVKMLSGTLVEWNDPASVGYDSWNVSWGASGGTGGPGDYYGAQHYGGIFYEVVVSSLDIGQNVRWDIKKANALKDAKNPLDRKNIEFALTGGNPNVEVLSQRDIYEAYKNRSNYVQAYLALENKGYGERPWNTYEKFIDGMCNMSSDKARCKKELAYHGHKDTEMQGNLYLGNGDMSIIGLYSEISSHGCHGATVISDKGEPAFGIELSSTWCFYIHASWGDYSTWQITSCEFFKRCCVEIGVETYEVDCCRGGEREGDDGEIECIDPGKCEEQEYYCAREMDHYILKEDWVSQGGGESSGDCGTCTTVNGYVNPAGNFTTDPYPISFYQSQPLLIRGN